MSIDQKTYDELMEEANTLFQHLDEWHEQLNDQTVEEASVRNAMACIAQTVTHLSNAKRDNAERDYERKEALIKRIETGTTTKQDALSVRRLMI